MRVAGSVHVCVSNHGQLQRHAREINVSRYEFTAILKDRVGWRLNGDDKGGQRGRFATGEKWRSLWVLVDGDGDLIVIGVVEEERIPLNHASVHRKLRLVTIVTVDAKNEIREGSVEWKTRNHSRDEIETDYVRQIAAQLDCPLIVRRTGRLHQVYNHYFLRKADFTDFTR